MFISINILKKVGFIFYIVVCVHRIFSILLNKNYQYISSVGWLCPTYKLFILYLYMYLYINLYIYLSIYISIYLSICLSINIHPFPSDPSKHWILLSNYLSISIFFLPQTSVYLRGRSRIRCRQAGWVAAGGLVSSTFNTPVPPVVWFISNRRQGPSIPEVNREREKKSVILK